MTTKQSQIWWKEGCKTRQTNQGTDMESFDKQIINGMAFFLIT